MPTICLDIKEDKRFSTTSPISMGVWFVCYLIINVLVPLGVLYFVLSLLSFALVHMFFQFEARLVFLSLRFLKSQKVLTPHFKDKAYIPNLTKFKKVEKAMHPRYFEKQKQKFENLEKIEEAHRKYLESLEKDEKGAK